MRAAYPGRAAVSLSAKPTPAASNIPSENAEKNRPQDRRRFRSRFPSTRQPPKRPRSAAGRTVTGRRQALRILYQLSVGLAAANDLGETPAARHVFLEPDTVCSYERSSERNERAVVGSVKSLVLPDERA